MAFTLQIKKQGIFGNKKLDIKKLLADCHLKFGSDNEFYILEEGKNNNGTVILYNPARIGRGIFFDGSKMSDGYVELSYNIPTTATEISDFIEIVKQIVSQFKKASVYCVEEKREYTVKQLEENKANMIQFSLDCLHDFLNKDYDSYILTLAMWPYTLNSEQVKTFSTCSSLNEFEETLHNAQAIDAYYAKPRCMKNKTDGKIRAIYTLTEECISIFPNKADDFINPDNIPIDEGQIDFYIYSENRMRDGRFSYDKFMAYMMAHGAKPYDATHSILPSITKDEIEKIVQEIS